MTESDLVLFIGLWCASSYRYHDCSRPSPSECPRPRVLYSPTRRHGRSLPALGRLLRLCSLVLSLAVSTRECRIRPRSAPLYAAWFSPSIAMSARAHRRSMPAFDHLLRLCVRSHSLILAESAREQRICLRAWTQCSYLCLRPCFRRPTLLISAPVRIDARCLFSAAYYVFVLSQSLSRNELPRMSYSSAKLWMERRRNALLSVT